MTPADKIRQRILEHALLFLAADVHVQEDRDKWRKLRFDHSGEDMCDPKSYPDGTCEACNAHLEASEYKQHLRRRSGQKKTMVRLYSQLAEAEL